MVDKKITNINLGVQEFSDLTVPTNSDIKKTELDSWSTPPNTKKTTNSINLNDTIIPSTLKRPTSSNITTIKLDSCSKDLVPCMKEAPPPNIEKATADKAFESPSQTNGQNTTNQNR